MRSLLLTSAMLSAVSADIFVRKLDHALDGVSCLKLMGCSTQKQQQPVFPVRCVPAAGQNPHPFHERNTVHVCRLVLRYALQSSGNKWTNAYPGINIATVANNIVMRNYENILDPFWWRLSLRRSSLRCDDRMEVEVI